METLSKLSDKCKKCNHVNDCNNKRMMACAVKEPPKEAAANLTVSLTNLLAAPMLRSHTPITINMGEYGKIDTSLEELQKQLASRLNVNCAFNKS